MTDDSCDYRVLKNDSSDVDLKIAVFLAQASHAAYCKKASKDTADENDLPPRVWAEKVGFCDTVKVFNQRQQDIQGFWCVQDDVALLAFRGTADYKQWLRDARFFPSLYRWSGHWNLIHTGFRKGVKAVDNELKCLSCKITESKNGGIKHLWVTGHSLGGALAVIAATKLKTPDISPRIYTYGEPRVGLGGFARNFNREFPCRLLRFINHQDIVPRVPIYPYHHTGRPKHIVDGVLRLAMTAAPVVRGERAERRIEALKRAVALPPEAPVLRASPGSAGGIHLEESEHPVLTPRHFADLKYGLGALRPESEGAPKEDLEDWIDRIPAFHDHGIGEYIKQLQQLASQARRKA